MFVTSEQERKGGCVKASLGSQACVKAPRPFWWLFVAADARKEGAVGIVSGRVRLFLAGSAGGAGKERA